MIDYKKDFKNIYGAYKKVKEIDVPEQYFLVVSGKGDPNVSSEFTNALEILYKFSYFIKMSYKKDYVIDTYVDYKVFPLEGDWTGNLDENNVVIKSTLQFDLMIAQPEFINESSYEYYLKLFKENNPEFNLRDLRLVKKEAHKALQCLHVGPYDEEIITFNKLKDYIQENNLQRTDQRYHKEIYLSDSRRVAPEKLKTLIRFELK